MEAITYDFYLKTGSETEWESRIKIASETRGNIFDQLSTDGNDYERYSWRLDKIFSEAYDHFCEFYDKCNRESDELDNWGKLDEKNKTHAMENYALLKMKMIEVYNGLPVEGNS